MLTWWPNLCFSHDITPEWLSKLCYDVTTEPPLQQLTRGTTTPIITNWQDEACTNLGQHQGAHLMLGFFTQMHLVIATQISNPSIGIMSRRR